MALKRTSIYIDGFNFYYRCLKGTPYKWLDFKSLFLKLLPEDCSILSIKYFTSHVSALGDPQRPLRQRTYIRALEQYIPELSVYYGKFLSHPVSMPLANRDYPEKSREMYHLDAFGKPIFKRVIKTEEKGSDVNIAVHLLNDAWLDKYDCAVLVSNDSDLAGSISLIKEHHPEREVGLVLPFESNPNERTHSTVPSKELMKRASFIRQVRKGVLADSQLPERIPNTNIYKPVMWYCDQNVTKKSQNTRQ